MGEERDVGGGGIVSPRALGQVCRIQMIVAVQNRIYDEVSILWTRAENNGGVE